MAQNYLDSRAICQAYGPLELFITFTCNPKRPEIEAIRFEAGQKPHDKNDMVTQVYHMKLQELFSYIKDGYTFGPVRADIVPSHVLQYIS